MSDSRKVYTLTQLNQSLENHFWKQFGERTFWVTAEVVKVNVKNGHHYLELADSKDNFTTARSFATIWARTYKMLEEQVGVAELGGILKPGNNVLFSLKIEFHSVYGLKLNVQQIDPSYSYGAIEKRRKEVIERLKKEGLLDLQKSLHLPVILKRIALIGSPDTSGFRDFQDELLNNHEFNNFSIKVFPVRVQGEKAAHELTQAVREAECYNVDVIVILRGGGSKMDLAIFDDYELAKSIASSRLPVLTGIGHETDKVVADMVAHTDLITPTAVARHIQYAIQSFWEIMRELHDKTMHYAQQQVSEERERFTHLNNYLQHYSRSIIQHWRSVFQEFEADVRTGAQLLINKAERSQKILIQDLIHQVQRNVQTEEHDLDRLFDRLFTYADQCIEQERDFILARTVERIEDYGIGTIERESVNLNTLDDLLGLLNPLKMLSAGYTISTIEEVDVHVYEGNQLGKEMKTLTSKSLIISEIKEVKSINKENEN